MACDLLAFWGGKRVEIAWQRAVHGCKRKAEEKKMNIWQGSNACWGE